MTEQVGKIEKPLAEPFRQRKKVYLVPLLYSSESAPSEYKEKYSHYWQQVTEQLANLEAKIGQISRIYHESISLSGDKALEVMEKLNPDSCAIAKSKCGCGAILEGIEEKELLEEVMDWERCLLVGLISEKVAGKVSEFYLEASAKRYEAMAKKLSETLKDNEAGLLFIREGHKLQFPADIEVFSVFPPELDQIQRWLRGHARAEEKEASAEQ